jgi:hypothetical protein
MKSLVSLSAVTALGVSLGVYACSANDSPDLSFGNVGGSGSGSTTSSSSTGSTNTGSTTSTGSATSTGQGGMMVNTSKPLTDPDASCGADTQPAVLTPVYMVFIYDRSGSMGDDPNGTWANMASRWTPMKQGMIDFFQNSGTIGIKAQLKFFPANGDKTQTCHADYKTGAMVSLEAPQTLISLLDSTTPSGGTPTLPAVLGGIARAKQLMIDDPGSKAVVVLVTDGEPGIYNATLAAFEHDCAPTGFVPSTGIDPADVNNIPQIEIVLNAARNGTPAVTTYVVGIGEASLDSLTTLAAAGSKSEIPPIILDATASPEVTRAKLTSELKKIRTNQFVCEMPIPDTAKFDKTLVNVNFKHTDGTIQEFGRSDACAAANGWHFNNDTTPTKIVLCPDTCTSIQKDLTGQLQILLDCPTTIL